MSSTAIPKVVPAQLSFLAVYNPALGTSDETFHQQIVFYYSRAAKARSKLSNGDTRRDEELREQENEKLRQVGLAQGMVGFAKSFSNGEAVDSVETQKSRIVLHELEAGWWILASIDLTQLPAASLTRTDSSTSVNEPVIEYSSREVAPPALLIQQLVRAHSIFLLHHGTTLEHMFAKHKRDKFCNILDKYWSRFAANWDVLLHGSPAVDMYSGLKLAAGGELGMGVGEEDWGSSERDVLEDFARRTEGLVDVMVSRFGEPSSLQHAKSSTDPKHLEASELEPWMGSGRSPGAPDGVVFSGMGAVSRASLRDLSQWIETIYCYGDQAYGIRENPTSNRRKRKRRNVQAPTSPPPENRKPAPKDRSEVAASKRESDLPPGIPPPIVKAVEQSLDKASAGVDKGEKSSGQDQKPLLASLGDTETWMKYMTLGYGTAWGGGKKTEDEVRPAAKRQPTRERSPSPAAMRYIEPEPDFDLAEEKLKMQIRQENDGYFLIGLKGDMYDAEVDEEDDDWNHRIPLRTVHVELLQKDDASSSGSAESEEMTPWERPTFEREPSTDSRSDTGLSRLRPVVYVHRPFIYTFLFSHRTSALSIASFYRDIHNFFSPLHQSLDRNTSPEKVAARLFAASNPHTTTSSSRGSDPNTQPIYDLVYDPRTLTVHSSLPNIPDPGTLIAEGLSSTSAHASGWSRVEALNVHSQILATISSTRRNLSEIERTCKTSRGWWVVWMRLPPSQTSSEEAAEAAESADSSAQFNTDELREAFLVRRARDAQPVAAKSSGSRFASGMWSSMGMGGGGQSQRMGGAAAGWGPKGLGEGIGIDARRYVEELLSLNR
ncbi:hypothetical protein HBH69_057930 [Parastagonospora nodorum]|nr:hypothetical protein HBH69_057930 [Parastagonospora nodorum]KAH5329916.1 hypothetical protein HBI12_067580 [Parastagonospora nodorum]KAH5479304.1 hypothetical protein HBI28_048060 [Parastagonospora nodorum]KAH5642313.1 hypothetical protein HBI22_047000 [Parastagonospora nodorum]